MGWDKGFEPLVFGTTIRRFNQLSQSHHNYDVISILHNYFTNVNITFVFKIKNAAFQRRRIFNKKQYWYYLADIFFVSNKADEYVDAYTWKSSHFLSSDSRPQLSNESKACWFLYLFISCAVSSCAFNWLRVILSPSA